jgi:VanZ family protein
MQISKIARTASWILATALVVLSVVPREFRPETGASNLVEHFVAYFVTGLAFGLGYVRSQYLLALLLVLFCGSVELIQKLVPGRHARLSDFIVDALAACAGLLVASLVSQIRARI